MCPAGNAQCKSNSLMFAHQEIHLKRKYHTQVDTSSQPTLLLTLLAASRVSPAPISHSVSIVTLCISPLPPPITATKRCRKSSDGERCDILQRGTLTYFPCTTREKMKKKRRQRGLKGEDGEREEEKDEW